MKRVLAKTSRALMVSLAFGATTPARSAPDQALVEGNTAFALNLYAKVKNQPGNLFFSPYSISTALAVTYAGARGETEKQMSLVLHLGAEQQAVHSAFGQLQRQLNEADKKAGIQMNIANALWGQKEHTFLPAFMQIATGDYQANINQVDFVQAAEPAREQINSWVEQQTKDKIRDILPPGSVTGATRLVLANAIYFKGLWIKQFEKAETFPQPFHLSATGQVQAPLMHHLDNVGYTEESDFQTVELPYKGGDLSMVILLPRQIEGCSSLEVQLTPELLLRLPGRMRHRQVEIFLPRFKLESSFDLAGTLGTMGMPMAFGSGADFSGMDGTRFLFLSGVFHKAWGEVNEEGTEAAAATAGVVALTSVRASPPPPPVFRADHPFIFFIRDVRSGTILFLGRLADPSH